MSNNISKIRENQKKIQELRLKIYNYEKEVDKIPKIKDFIIETHCEDLYYGADKIADLILDFVDLNTDVLNNEQKVKLQETVQCFNEIDKQKREVLNKHSEYVRKIRKEIVKYRDEILLLIQEDFKFESEKLVSFKVPIMRIEDYKDIVIKYLDDNNIPYCYLYNETSNKIQFLQKNEKDVDIRELIQNEIRKVDPAFNFKSYADKTEYSIDDNKIINILYL